MRLPRLWPFSPVVVLLALGCAPHVEGGGGTGASPTGTGGSPRVTTQEPGGLGGGLRLRAGADNTCVVSGAGHVACWGSAETGQLGLGDRTDHWTPAWIPSLTGVADLAVADFAMCARKLDGSVWCWGMNDYGEFGTSTPSDCPGLPYACSTVPVLSPVSGTVSLAAGSHSLCAVDEIAGTVQCWGAGPTVDASGYHVLSAAAGYFHTCVRFAPGPGQDPARNVVCYGTDDSGELGTGAPGATGPVAAGVPGGFVELAAGDNSTCGMGAGGEVLCWGQNVYGALGQDPGDGTDLPESCPGDGACSRHPVQVPGLPPVAHIAARFEQACALTTTGQVYCWGTPSRTSPASAGACYPGNPSCSPVPALVPGVEGAVQIALGYGHACALTAAEEVLCWGLDTHGQLGRGAGPGWDATPVKVVIPPEPT